jgi:hypothetical protein
MLAAKPAVNTVAVITAAVINRTNYLVNVLQPKNTSGFFIATQTIMREMPAFMAVSPATAYMLLHFFTFSRCLLNYMFYMLTTFSLTLPYIVTERNAFVNISA